MSAQLEARPARRRGWTTTELATLRREYPRIGGRCASLIPGHTQKAVRRRASIEGIGAPGVKPRRARPVEGVPSTLAQRLQNWRARRRITMAAAARRCEIPYQTWRRLEADGQYDPSASLILAIYRGTGMQPDYLLLGD